MLFLILRLELLAPARETREPGEPDVRAIVACLTNFVFDKNEKVTSATHNAFQALGQLDVLGKLPLEVFIKLMGSLTGVITSQLSEGKLARGGALTSLFYTIMEMIVYVPVRTLQEPTVAKSLFDAISLGIKAGRDALKEAAASASDDDKRKKATPAPPKKSVKDIQIENAGEICEAAESLLAFILNMYNNFPSPPGATVVSSDFSELDMLAEEKSLVVSSPKIHHFVFNDYSLLTIMESPEKKESVRVVLRDMTGKYCWEHSFVVTKSVSSFTSTADAT